MIKAKPLSEQECLEANLIPKGIYPFTVLNTQEKNSAKVGAFFSLKHNVLVNDTKLRVCFDALFFTEEMMWKTRHFYSSTKMMDKYNKGEYMAQDCDHAEGYLEIDHRFRKDNGVLEHYVKDYIVPEGQSDEPAKIEEAPFFDDDIPANM